MAVFTVAQLLFGLFMSLVLTIFVLIPVHNAITETIFTSGVVISKLSAQVADVIFYGVGGFAFLCLVFSGIYAYNLIVYKTAGGY